MKVLIPGMASLIGRKVALLLRDRGHDVAGMDMRPWFDPPKGIVHHRVDIRKRSAEDVFRKFKPDAVIHMATVTSLLVQGEERFRINLGGTQAVFDHCVAHGVKRVVVVGRHTYYGAGPDSALFHTENEPPTALGAFPELSDLVAADLYAGTALWRYPELTTTLLRVCYTLGPSGHGTLASFLKGKRVPMVMGYDPLMQFLHEQDAVAAIVLALEKQARGIFNVVGPRALPLSLIAKMTGRTVVPLPEFVIGQMLGRFGIPSLPRGALEHIKYPIVADGSLFLKATGFQFEHDELETLRSFAEAFRV
jgi:UDP-glucose 4-epimerase